MGRRGGFNRTTAASSLLCILIAVSALSFRPTSDSTGQQVSKNAFESSPVICSKDRQSPCFARRKSSTDEDNMEKIKLDALLSLPLDEFVAAIGGIYEATPWIVEEFYVSNLSPSLDAFVVAATKGRITNVRILFEEIRQYIKNGSREKKLDLLKSHPDLCLKIEQCDDITEESRQEQGRAGLSTLTAEERSKFLDLNRRYKSRFNFPFILAVRNASKYTVLNALEGRVDATMEEELSCALSQGKSTCCKLASCVLFSRSPITKVDKIAWMRLLTKVDHAEGADGHGGFLTCHVLDTANGSPAAGMQIELYKYDEGSQKRELLKTFVTNSDGRLDGGPALKGPEFDVGQYEWIFYVGDYFARYSLSRLSGVPFLDVIPLRFGLDDPTEHYHVPLLVSPWSYSTYRGS